MEKKELLTVVPSFARGLNILLVDYDTTSLMYLASMLEQYSYNVTTTELASVALSMIRDDNDRFKLVMANFNMPDMDSLSFLRVLLQKEIPVILMASERNVTVAWKALAAGACFFLEKPISLDDLKYVWQHVHRKRSRNPLKDESRKSEKDMVNIPGKFSQEISIKQVGGIDSYQNIRVNIPTEQKKKIMEASKSFPVGKNSVKGSQNTCTGQQLTANEGKRSVEEEKGGERREERRRKLNKEDINDNNVIAKEEVRKEMSEHNGNSGEKKTSRRIVWTPELHCKFTAALSALGDRKARPKLILQIMNVPHLTQRQVASHLQKYKAQVQRICENFTTDLPSICTPSSTYASGALQTLKSHDFAVGGTTQAADTVQGKYKSVSSSNVINAGKSPLCFSDKNQEVNFNEVPKPPADSNHPASTVNQNPPSSEYADILKLFDEDEEQLKAGLGGGPNAGELDQYCKWLAEALLENS